VIRHKVLLDIRVAGATAHAGIPNDLRLLAKVLDRAESVDLGLLIHPDFQTRKFRGDVRANPVLAASRLIHGYGLQYGDARPKKGLLGRFVDAVRKEVGKRTPYEVAPVDKTLSDSIWRKYFPASLSHQDRLRISQLAIYVSALPENEIDRWRRQWRALDTAGFDFVIFPDLRFLKVAEGTIKIFRFHDVLPITAPDTFDKGAAPDRQFHLLEHGCNDSFIVCNSEPTRDQLVSLFPRLEARCAVIPCTMPDLAIWQSTEASLGRIVSSRSVTCNSVHPVSDQSVTDNQEYVLMVSTLEPRKNHLGAIEAFQRVRSRLGRDIKFIIVGAPGWKYSPIVKAIAEGIQTHSIIHLAEVSQNELAFLYQKAAAVLFPSFAEGFGYPPLEALQCGTPSVVSDIATLRWALKDAALFADPYDPDAIATQLLRLLHGTNEKLRAQLRSNGSKVLDAYSATSTSPQWEALFDRIKSGLAVN
jgi:glycosyltransferase involved in cell wall biosynthesis